MSGRFIKQLCTLCLIITSIVLPCSFSQGTVVIEYFESQYHTIEKRMPDLFMAGYDGIWIPPTNRADSGNQSVGYDCYDRFDLGNPSDPTLYGTEAYLRGLIYAAHSTDIKIYPDTIFNHDGFRNKYTTGFAGYPGFALTFPSGPDATWGDFHDYSATGDWYTQISGLVDIAQENDDVYIRQPITVDSVNNLPGMWVDTTFARFFSDPSPLPGDATTRDGFNLTHPYRGVPVAENATGLLLRYAKWMLDVNDADGFRLDAAKNIFPWFFSSFLDYSVEGRGRPNRDGSPSNPLQFCEVYDGSSSLAYSYTNLAANRLVLDFPLYFPMYSALNANGYGDFKSFINASVDGGDFGTNGVGMAFVSCHDSGISPPANDNLAYAYILTRPGRPIVYFNAQEFGTGRSSFPIPGRGDALGGIYGNQITSLVAISNQYAQGPMIQRWVNNQYNNGSNATFYVFERATSLIVALDLQQNAGYDAVTVNTLFPTGSVLVELTGNAADSTYNQGGAVFTQVTVDGNGNIPINIPRSNLMRGYVMYGLRNPQGTLTISSVNSIIPPDDTTVWDGIRRITPIPVITTATVTLTLQTDSTENNVIYKLDDGYASLVTGDTSPAGGLILTGNFSGFQQVTSGLYVTATKSVGTTGGTGTYTVNIPTSILSQGIHYFTYIAFLERPAGSPPCFNTFKQVFYVDKNGPVMSLISPTYTGSSNVTTQGVTVTLTNPDLTANSVYVFPDWTGPHTVAALEAALNNSNQATWTDRTTFTWNWQDITNGNHTLDILAYEQTGNASVTTFTNINAVLELPQMQLVFDESLSASSVNFVSMPSQINTDEFGDIVVRVNTYKDSSTLYSFANGDYYVDLQIDTAVYVAVAYNPALLPPINNLVQNRRYFGDYYDEFRLYWEGYSSGDHTFTAHAHLNPQTTSPNSVGATVNVPNSTPGPALTILSPLSGTTVSDPRTVSVQVQVDSTAHSIQAYMNDSTGILNLLGEVDIPQLLVVSSAQTTITITGQLSDPNNPGSPGVQVGNGTYLIQAIGASGNQGTGLTSIQTSNLSIINWNTVTIPGSNGTGLGFTASPTSGNGPLNVTFIDTTGGNPSTWAWNFGDGSTSSLQSTNHIYSVVNTLTSYTVQLIVSNSYGAATIISPNLITVSEPPPGTNGTGLGFYATPTSGIGPLNVSFVDTTGGNPTTWAWNFGDGGTGSLQSTSHMYAAVTSPTTYLVQLIVGNAFGASTVSYPNLIYVTGTAATLESSLPSLKLFTNQGLNSAFDLSEYVTYGSPTGYSSANSFLGLSSVIGSEVDQSAYSQATVGINSYLISDIFGSNTSTNTVKYSTYKIQKLPKVGLTAGSSWDVNVASYTISSGAALPPPSFGNNNSLIISDLSEITAYWVGSTIVRVVSFASFNSPAEVDVIASPLSAPPYGVDIDKERIQVYPNILAHSTFSTANDTTIWAPLELAPNRTVLATQSWVSSYTDSAGTQATGVWQFNFANSNAGVKSTPVTSTWIGMSTGQWYTMRMRVVADQPNTHQSILFGYNNWVGQGFQTDIAANILFGIPTVWTWQETPLLVHGNSTSGYPQFQFKASASGNVYIDEIQIINSVPTLVDSNRSNTRLFYPYGNFTAGSETTGWGQEIYSGASTSPIISVVNNALQLNFTGATSGNEIGLKWTANNGGSNAATFPTISNREVGVRATVSIQTGDFNSLGIILVAAYGVQTAGEQNIGSVPSNLIAAAGVGILLGGTYRTVAQAVNGYYQMQFGVRSDLPGIVTVSNVDLDRDQDDPNYGDPTLYP